MFNTEKQKQQVREWKIKNVERYKQKIKEWKKENKNRVQYLIQKKYPEKYKARHTLHNALISGKIQKQPCELCRYTTTEAHHSDYNKPLEVVWLCKKHHTEIHMEETKTEETPEEKKCECAEGSSCSVCAPTAEAPEEEKDAE